MRPVQTIRFFSAPMADAGGGRGKEIEPASYMANRRSALFFLKHRKATGSKVEMMGCFARGAMWSILKAIWFHHLTAMARNPSLSPPSTFSTVPPPFMLPPSPALGVATFIIFFFPFPLRRSSSREGSLWVVSAFMSTLICVEGLVSFGSGIVTED